jgi:hypothetical protein
VALRGFDLFLLERGSPLTVEVGVIRGGAVYP